MKFKHGQNIEYRYDEAHTWYKGTFISYDEGLCVIKSKSRTVFDYDSFGESNVRECLENKIKEKTITDMINDIISEPVYCSPSRFDMGILYDKGWRKPEINNVSIRDIAISLALTITPYTKPNQIAEELLKSFNITYK